MLEPLRQRVRKALSVETAATLSTNGRGGIQAGFFPCAADGLTLYFLVPSASDLLFNLEMDTAVVVTTPRWQMEGDGKIHPLPVSSGSAAVRQLARSPHAAGCVLVAVPCQRIHFSWENGWGYRETIDL
jgi:hypothetical protein